MRGEGFGFAVSTNGALWGNRGLRNNKVAVATFEDLTALKNFSLVPYKPAAVEPMPPEEQVVYHPEIHGKKCRIYWGRPPQAHQTLLGRRGGWNLARSLLLLRHTMA